MPLGIVTNVVFIESNSKTDIMKKPRTLFNEMVE